MSKLDRLKDEMETIKKKLIEAEYATEQLEKKLETDYNISSDEAEKKLTDITEEVDKLENEQKAEEQKAEEKLANYE